MALSNSPEASSSVAIASFKMRVEQFEPLISVTGTGCNHIELTLKTKYTYLGENHKSGGVYHLNTGDIKILQKKFILDLSKPHEIEIRLKEEWRDSSLALKKDLDGITDRMILDVGSIFSTVNYSDFFIGKSIKLKDDKIPSGAPILLSNLKQLFDDGGIGSEQYKDGKIYLKYNNILKSDVKNFYSSFLTEWDNKLENIITTKNSWKQITIPSLLIDFINEGEKLGIQLYISANHNININNTNAIIPIDIRNVIKPDIEGPTNNEEIYFFSESIRNENKFDIHIEGSVYKGDPYEIPDPPLHLKSILSKKKDMVDYWTAFLEKRANSIKEKYFKNCLNVIASSAQEINPKDSLHSDFYIEKIDGSFTNPTPFLYRYTDGSGNPDISKLKSLNLERGAFPTAALFIWDYLKILNTTILYDSDEWEYLQVADPKQLEINKSEVDRIAKLLFDFPRIEKIEIQGHTSSKPPHSITNLVLSEKRAENIYLALLNHPLYGQNLTPNPPSNKSKITQSRLTKIGYGATKLAYKEKMKSLDTKDEIYNLMNMAKNRRVVIAITQLAGCV